MEQKIKEVREVCNSCKKMNMVYHVYKKEDGKEERIKVASCNCWGDSYQVDDYLVDDI